MKFNGGREAKIKVKIMNADRAIYANKRILKTKVLLKFTNITIFKSLIRPILLVYAAVTNSMTKKTRRRLESSRKRSN